MDAFGQIEPHRGFALKSISSPSLTPEYQALQDRLSYSFKDSALLLRALTHRSFGFNNNERLEFLGDSVLGTAISMLLYDQFKNQDEGDLSRIRAHLIREESLYILAQSLGLPALIRLSDGEARDGGRQRPSILADAYEALIGALYLDGGYAVAHAWVRQQFHDWITQSDLSTWNKDAKTELQEWLQARKLNPPSYRIVATSGQAHAQIFEVECAISTLSLSQKASGRSRRAAEQLAAKALIDILKSSDKPGGALRS